jgi:hypothetical protein
MSKNSNFLMGLFFIGGGIFIIIMFSKLTILECLRSEPSTNQGQCQLISQGIIGSKTTKTIAIKSLQGAKIEESRDSDGDSTYRVVLLTQEGNIPFTKDYSSGKFGKEKNMNEVRNFLSNKNQTSLKLKQDDRWWFIVGVAFGIIGISLVLGK